MLQQIEMLFWTCNMSNKMLNWDFSRIKASFSKSKLHKHIHIFAFYPAFFHLLTKILTLRKISWKYHKNTFYESMLLYDQSIFCLHAHKKITNIHKDCVNIEQKYRWLCFIRCHVHEVILMLIFSTWHLKIWMISKETYHLFIFASLK